MRLGFWPIGNNLYRNLVVVGSVGLSMDYSVPVAFLNRDLCALDEIDCFFLEGRDEVSILVFSFVVSLEIVHFLVRLCHLNACERL